MWNCIEKNKLMKVHIKDYDTNKYEEYGIIVPNKVKLKNIIKIEQTSQYDRETKFKELEFEIEPYFILKNKEYNISLYFTKEELIKKLKEEL